MRFFPTLILILTATSLAQTKFTVLPDGKTAMITLSDMEDKYEDAITLFKGLKNEEKQGPGFTKIKEFQSSDQTLFAQCGRPVFGDMGGTCSFGIKAGPHSTISGGHATWTLEETNHALAPFFLGTETEFHYSSHDEKMQIHVTADKFSLTFN